MPQLLKPACLEPTLNNKRSHRNEKPAHRNEESPPLAATREEPTRSNKDPMQPKKKIIIIIINKSETSKAGTGKVVSHGKKLPGQDSLNLCL